jgi:hypothetical protein
MSRRRLAYAAVALLIGALSAAAVVRIGIGVHHVLSMTAMQVARKVLELMVLRKAGLAERVIVGLLEIADHVRGWSGHT